jgi:glycosyltransferase involved in cell wall biosynthesis
MFNDYVIAVSEATRTFHRRYNLVRKSRIEVVHNFINDRWFHLPHPAHVAQWRLQLGIRPEQRLLGIVGDVIPRKGLIHLVRALPAVVRAVPDAQLLCAGFEHPDYAPMVRAEAVRLGVAERITWMGARQDVENIMAAIDVYVLPSLEENLPLAILEAMASSRPVVATHVGGIPECVSHAQSGLLVPPARHDVDQVERIFARVAA